MKLCREAYAKLKVEITAIDRKKKKLKRCHVEKSNNGNNNSFLNANNNHAANDE